MIRNSLIRLAAALLATTGANAVAAGQTPAAKPEFHALSAKSGAPAKPQAELVPVPVRMEMVGTLDASGNVRVECRETANPAYEQYVRERGRQEER